MRIFQSSGESPGHPLRFQHLQLVHLFALIEFAIVFYEVSLLLRRSERPPMREYPWQAIGAEESPAWAGVQLRSFFVGHFNILCRLTNIASHVEWFFIEQKVPSGKWLELGVAHSPGT